MENKKTLKVLLISLCIYILLSWVIVSGSYATGAFSSDGYNPVGVLDIILAPIMLFNQFATTIVPKIDNTYMYFGYGNIILAFITIGMLYGVLNKTGAYHRLIDNMSKKMENSDKFVLIVVTLIYFFISATLRIPLVLFLFLPFVAALLMKLKYNRVTTFTATIGAMLMGQLGSLFSPAISVDGEIYLSLGLNNILPRLVLFVLLLVVLLATLLLKKDNKSDNEEIPLLEDDEEEKSYVPIVISSIVVTLILIVGMFNYKYMFNYDGLTDAYDKVMNTTIAGYPFMKTIMGMIEPFGFFTGFTMSALLIIQILVLKFIYSIDFNKTLDGIKKGIVAMLPVVGLSMISLSLIVLSFNNPSNFVLTIVNKILDLFPDIQTIGVLLSSFIHSLFFVDFDNLVGNLLAPFADVYGSTSSPLSLFMMQVGYGISALITPFSVYLIAGLAYLKVPYTKWFKYILIPLVIIVVLCVATVMVTDYVL